MSGDFEYADQYTTKQQPPRDSTALTWGDAALYVFTSKTHAERGERYANDRYLRCCWDVCRSEATGHGCGHDGENDRGSARYPDVPQKHRPLRARVASRHTRQCGWGRNLCPCAGPDQRGGPG